MVCIHFIQGSGEFPEKFLYISRLQRKAEGQPPERWRGRVHRGKKPSRRSISAPGEEKLEPDIDISSLLQGKTTAPENSIVTAAFTDKLNGGSEPVEDDVVTVLLEVPQAEEAESGGRARRSGRREAAHRSGLNLAVLLRLRSNRTPELASEVATEQNMARSLQRRGADGAAALIGCEDLFAKEVGAALDAVFDSKPPEESDLGRGEIVPDEFVPIVNDPAVGAQLVESGGAQFPARLAAERERAHVDSVREPFR
jgi:hypothetical protein